MLIDLNKRFLFVCIVAWSMGYSLLSSIFHHQSCALLKIETQSIVGYLPTAFLRAVPG